MKWRILIDSRSSPNFAIRTEKMDSVRLNFDKMLVQFIAQKDSFLFRRNLSTFMSGGQFLLNVHKSDVRNVRKCFPVTRAFTENALR